MFAVFERLVQPYPEALPATPPGSFLRFVWAGSHGLRRYIALMTGFTAAIGVFEALLFAMLGEIVDWLGAGAARRGCGPNRRARWRCWARCCWAAPC